MPYDISRSDGGYKVTSPHGTKAKKTTKSKAKKQVRLLNAIDHGFMPDKGDPYRSDNLRPKNPFAKKK